MLDNCLACCHEHLGCLYLQENYVNHKPKVADSEVTRMKACPSPQEPDNDLHALSTSRPAATADKSMVYVIMRNWIHMFWWVADRCG